MENAGGTLQHTSGTTVEVGNPYLLVLRADFTTGDDVFTLYINPTPGQAEPVGGTIKNDFNFGMFNDIFLYATGAFSIDELRIGPHFADVVPSLPGDYNLNGVVDATDYTVWRDHLGQDIALVNQDFFAATPGVVDAEDYDFWKSRFGESLDSGAGQFATVPEPASLLVIGLAAIAILCCRSIYSRHSLCVPQADRD